MKSKRLLLTAVVVSCLFTALNSATAQSTAFTYQGRLQNNGVPASGTYNLTFALFTNNAGGTAIAGPVTNNAVVISSGLFTVTIDFGAGVWNGESSWLEIAVETNGSTPFNTLAPRQEVTPAPYAIFAPIAGSANSVAAANVSGTLGVGQLPPAVVVNNQAGVNLSGDFTGNGASLTNIPLSGLAGGSLGLVTNSFGFVVAGTIGVGNTPYVVVAATNLNGAGHVDLVVPNNTDNTLTVLTNNGSGGFSTMATPAVGIQPESVAVIDVNNDGRPDLISANSGSNTLTVLTNNGAGGFGSNTTLVVGLSPTCVIAADVNGDHKLDLITANQGTNTLTILTNNGAGGFGLNSTVVVGLGPVNVIAADVNNDGRPDLICANFTAGANSLTVLINNGDGTFLPATYPVGNQPQAVVAVDVNGDGWLDLACVNRGDFTLTVLTNNQNGTFTTASTSSGIFSIRVLAVMDLNGDGRPDLVGGPDFGSLQELINTGNGTFAPGPTLTPNIPGLGLRGVVAVDVNGDGKPDLISGNFFGNSLVELLNDSGQQSLDLTLAGQNGGLRFAPGLNGAPDLIGGSSSNIVDANLTGAVIAGGGSATNFNHISSDESSIGGGEGNTIQASADHSSIGGGDSNTVAIFAADSVIGGGLGNSIQSSASQSVIGGGSGNTIDAQNSFIGGGSGNVIQNFSSYGVIAGGLNNTNDGDRSAIGGGWNNSIQGDFAVIGGGWNNTAQANTTTIAGGTQNTIVGFGAQNATIGGGAANTIEDNDNSATIAGGSGNTIQTNAFSATIGGGDNNQLQPLTQDSTIDGGSGNTIQTNSSYSAIGGGSFNSVQVNSSYSTIGGGNHNNIQSGGVFGFIGGGFGNNIETNGDSSSIVGGSGNTIVVNAGSSFIGGGGANTIGANASYATIPGGFANNVLGQYGFAAGQNAQANHNGAFVWSDASSGSPFSSTAANQFSVRATGGIRFVTSGAGFTVDGQAVVTTNAALRAGGNTFTGQQTITGGNVGIGTTSPVAALHVRGPDAGQFTLQNSADNSSWYFADDASDNLVFQPNTGFGAYIDRAGNYHNNSDVRLKRDITPLGGVLDRVLQLRPVSYHFRTGPEGAPLTLGLIAQEVEPLFPEVVGERADTKSLAYTELVPVTIRAIQELNQKVEDQKGELKQKQTEITDLKKRLDALEDIVRNQNQNEPHP